MLCDKITIRQSRKSDEAAIGQVLTKAFGRINEARLALALIKAKNKTISLVGDCNGRVVGHVLLTAIKAPAHSMALAPLAVMPEFREMQVGSSLVREAIARARKAKTAAIFVLGDSGYYERFGFSSPLADPFEAGWQGRNFMALELVENCLQGKSGKLDCPRSFFNS